MSLRKTPSSCECKSAALVGLVVQKGLEHVQRWTGSPLRNHVSSTLRQNHRFKVYNQATTVLIKGEHVIQMTE